MPARLDLTPEQMLQRIREKTRERVKRYRERRNASGDAGSVTPAPENVRLSSIGNVTPGPPHTPPSSPLSLEREIREALAPLTERGYVHDPRFWVLASEQYPQLCLELEALKLADWLQEPRNSKRRCSKAFLDNWLRKAETDRQARLAGPPPSNGQMQAMRVDPPIAFQHNRQPPDDVALPNGELVPITREEFQRTLDANRGLPLEQKLARLNGRLRGGKP